MSITITLKEASCRGCGLCVETCPTDVFAIDETSAVSKVVAVSDCIGCLSCAYACPSGTIAHEGVHLVRNFYRDLSFSSRLARYL